MIDRSRTAMVLAMFACALPVAGAPVGEQVRFDSPGIDPATGKPTVVRALLFRPERPPEPPDERLPAVVVLHGCGGLYSSVKSRRESLSIRHHTMAQLLVNEGYIVVLPDSFRSRGVEEICSVETRLRTITGLHRRQDAQAALAWLQRRDDVRADRIAVLGWSHGGSAVLAALNGREPSIADWSKRTPPVPYFRAGVAFYPGCDGFVTARRGYSLAAPLTMYIGGRDDWTAPEPCIGLAARLADAGEPASITVYPEAYHGFDGPSGQKRLHLDVPNGVNPGQGVTVAVDPVAREDAYAKLKTFLHQRLAP